jgi:hypothetical protein
MTIKKMRLPGGVELSPENIEGVGGADLTRDGELAADSSDNELKVRLDGVTETVVTEDQIQTVTNKTIDADLNTISELEVDNLKAGVLNTSTSLLGASDSDIPSALAVKTYIDDKAAAQNEASEIIFDPTASGLSATNVQDAIDEVEARVDTAESDIINNATAISDHITDTVDAHDASAISSIPAGNLSATDVQAALNELQSDIDTNTSGLSNHIGNATDAHDASAISNVPSGTISAITVQAAIDELDTEKVATTVTVNGYALSANVTLAKADVGLGNVDNTSDATKDSATATLTNKTITGASIQTPTRLDVKQDTKANLETYALTASNGQIVFATDTKEYFAIKDTLLSDLGGGGAGVGGTDILSADQADKSAVTDYTEIGLEIPDTPIVLHGTKSFRLQHASSIKSFKKVIPVDRKFRGKNNAAWVDVVSTATQGNLNIIFRDETNSVDLTTSQQITTGSLSVTGTTANASDQLTALSNTTVNSLSVGMVITGSAIPVGTTITAISTSSATMSQNATGVSTGIRVSALVAKQVYSFNIPANCLSFSWAISSAVEVSAESYIDDVVVQLTEVALTSTSVTLATTPPTVQRFLSGTGTYTKPANATYIKIRMVGAGGGGGGSQGGGAGGNGGAGGSTTFSPNLTAGGGSGGSGNNVSIPGSAAGGVNTITAGPTILSAFSGGASTSAANNSSVATAYGGSAGGSSHFGGSGAGGAQTTAGGAGAANSGSGGGGAGGTQGANAATCGGGSGAFIEAVIASPASSYSYTIGTGGSAGSGSTLGGAGSAGYIEVTEFYSTSTTIPLTSAQLVQQSDSSLELRNANGFGSTNTKTRRFSLVDVNIGSDILYTDSATLGGSFKALSSGLYDISYTDEAGGSNLISYITKNNPDNGVASSIQTITLIAANGYGAISKEIYLNKDDVIYASVHAPANANSASTNARFSIAKQGSLKQINFSNDSKITIPTHQLRFEGASARGSTDTAIVKFDTQAITRGDAWSVVNTAANGTVVTMSKAGKLSVSSNATLGDNNYQITLNQLTLTGLSNTPSEVMASTSNATGRTKSISVTFDVKVGDKIRVNSDGTPSADNAKNTFTLSLTENSIPANFSNVLPQWSQSDSSIRLNTGNGYGSTNTAIKRFSNVVENLGSDITYADSATLGASFTANSDGIYNISYTEQVSVAAYIGLSKNSSQLSTAIFNISTADRLSMASPASAGYNGVVSWSGYLAKGDVIRAHNDGVAQGAQSDRSSFTISKVGKPNLSSVDVTSFVNMKTTDTQSSTLIQTSTFGAVNISGALTSNTNNGIYSYDSITGIYTALKSANVSVTASLLATSTGIKAVLTKNTTVLSEFTSTNAPGYDANVAANFTVVSGDTFKISNANAATTNQQWITVLATADNNATASPTQQVSSDTMSFNFKATAITATDAIGTFNTYTYAASTNTATIAGTAPTQTVASMNIDGIRVFGRAYNATSTTASPARVDVFIGKGLKSYEVLGYAALAKASPVSMDNSVYSTINVGIMKDYDEVTGILKIMSPTDHTLATTSYRLVTSANGAITTSGYFVFNASKSPSLVTIPNLAPRIAYVTEQQLSGTNSGYGTAGVWNTRQLNTITDSSGIVTSLSSNTVTLPAGTYKIDAWGMYYAGTAGLNKTRLRNTTDSTTALVGSSEYSGTSAGTNKSIISGEITITSPKSFQLQHYFPRTGTDVAGTNAALGENELYSSLTIQRIK